MNTSENAPINSEDFDHMSENTMVEWPKTAVELGYRDQVDEIPEKRVTLGNWSEGETVRWSFQNACKLVPSAEIYRGSGKRAKIKSDEVDLNKLDFKTHKDAYMSVEEMLAQTYTDGFLVMHKGKAVTEQYYNGQKPHTKHLLQSVTKSFVGTLAVILIEENLLNPDKLVSDYVPRLKDCAYGDATVRQVMDMTASVLYEEHYGVVSELTKHESSAGWRPRTGPLSDVPESQELFLTTLQKEADHQHGDRFAYRSCNTDVLGWVIEKATEKRVADLLSEYIWSKLGAEENAQILLDPWGLSAASGGLNITLRDMARFGQMMLQGGDYNGHSFFSKDVTKDIQTGGSNKQWSAGDGSGLGYLMPKGSYRNQWWITGFKSGSYYAAGIHGQHLFIAPKARVVIAKMSSQPQAITPEYTQNTLYAFEAIAEHLAGRTKSRRLFGKKSS